MERAAARQQHGRVQDDHPNRPDEDESERDGRDRVVFRVAEIGVGAAKAEVGAEVAVGGNVVVPTVVLILDAEPS